MHESDCGPGCRVGLRALLRLGHLNLVEGLPGSLVVLHHGHFHFVSLLQPKNAGGWGFRKASELVWVEVEGRPYLLGAQVRRNQVLHIVLVVDAVVFLLLRAGQAALGRREAKTTRVVVGYSCNGAVQRKLTLCIAVKHF
jgi:hypothetical protein